MKKTFLLIFCSYIIFFILTPPVNTPDEKQHYENAYWLLRFTYPYQLKKGQTPNLFVDDLYSLYHPPLNFDKIKISPLRKIINYPESQRLTFKPITLQSYHPPLYYGLISLSMLFSNLLRVDLISRFYLARIFSGFFYFGIVFFSYRILKLLFKEAEIVSSLLILFSLNPTVLKTGVGINPDLGMAFFAYLLLFMVIKLTKKNVIRVKQLILLAVISAFAALSKFSGIFTLTFVFIHLLFRRKSRFFLASLLFLLTSLLLISPWLIFNWQRYGTLSTQAFYLAETKLVHPRPFFVSLITAGFEFRHTVMHYAGFLGATNEIMPPKLFFISFTILFTLLAGIGFIKSFTKKNFKIIYLYLVSLGFFLYLLSFYFKKGGFSWDIQGRYFLAGWLPFIIFVFFGLLTLLKGRLRLTAVMITVFSFLHFYFTVFFVFIPGYYQFKNLSWQLESLYPFFSLIFFTWLFIHWVLSLSIMKRLFDFKIRKYR